MKLVTNNEEPVEPAPDRFKFVIEVQKDQYLEMVFAGVLSFSGPLLAVYATDEEGYPPIFATPYHRVVYFTKIEPEEARSVN